MTGIQDFVQSQGHAYKSFDLDGPLAMISTQVCCTAMQVVEDANTHALIAVIHGWMRGSVVHGCLNPFQSMSIALPLK